VLVKKRHRPQNKSVPVLLTSRWPHEPTQEECSTKTGAFFDFCSACFPGQVFIVGVKIYLLPTGQPVCFFFKFFPEAPKFE
jgi:hypothetical protein